MERVLAEVKLYNREMKRSKRLSLMVDTGLIYTWVSERTLKRLGVTSQRIRTFTTTEGKEVTRDIGEGVIEYDGFAATTVLVFAEKSDVEVLGLHALEGLALEVDPVRRRLKRASSLQPIVSAANGDR